MNFFKDIFTTIRSVLTDHDTSSTNDTSAEGDRKMNQKVSINLPLPLDVIEIILSYVPAEDLLTNCIFVEQWTDIINSNSLWLLKCLRKWKKIVKPNPVPQNFYRHLYGLPLGVNLIQNTCGKDVLNKWTVTENGGNGWRVEHPPEGADIIPETECQYCFATSFSKCEKFQVINLGEWNVTLEMMNIVRPEIHVSEWHAARWDCGSKYHLEVELRDKTSEVLDSFEYNHSETQWTGRHWQKVQHVFMNYPEGVKYITFLHRGRDTQFWSGYYGSKMAKASVMLML